MIKLHSLGFEERHQLTWLFGHSWLGLHPVPLRSAKDIVEKLQPLGVLDCQGVPLTSATADHQMFHCPETFPREFASPKVTDRTDISVSWWCLFRYLWNDHRSGIMGKKPEFLGGAAAKPSWARFPEATLQILISLQYFLRPVSWLFCILQIYKAPKSPDMLASAHQITWSWTM